VIATELSGERTKTGRTNLSSRSSRRSTPRRGC